MNARRLFVVVMLLGVVATAGCRASAPENGSGAGQEPSAGLRLAPGLYELEDGRAQAIGTLEWVDLEGGFWAVTDGTQVENGVAETVAVIANGADFADELGPLEGKPVSVLGTVIKGASIRMAGPEVEMESIEEMSDTPGAAE